MAQEDIYDILESKIDVIKKIKRREHDADDRKTYDEVFDHATLLAIYKLISDKILNTIEFPISSGKEANIFKGTTVDKKDIAIKIYRVSTSTVRNYMKYIIGDPRFKNIKKDHRQVVYAWARKEFKNLQRMNGAGVRVPKPIAYRNNLLLMEYIGDENIAAPILKDTLVKAPRKKLQFIIDNVTKMYADANLVHGDLSEYNVLVKNNKLIIIDVAQAVLLVHPMAEELLRRDVNNISRYFRDYYGLESEPEKILEQIRGK
ncbi:MAG: serine protein kinase RIO [Thermoplasmata archaeon]|nr:serine protein kinase RIO [Thermoplasmata archaeon]